MFRYCLIVGFSERGVWGNLGEFQGILHPLIDFYCLVYKTADNHVYILKIHSQDLLQVFGHL